MNFVEMADHRDVGADFSPGGSTRPYVIEALPKARYVVRTATPKESAVVRVEYGADVCFRVEYHNGVETRYDCGGNLRQMKLDVTEAFEAMPDEISSDLNPDTAAAIGVMRDQRSRLVMDVDLADGLVRGDLSAWVQIVPDVNLETPPDHTDINGREVMVGESSMVTRVRIDDEQDDAIGYIFIKVGLTDSILKIGVGDDRFYYISRYKRQVNADQLALLRTPAGAIRFLTSLMEG